MSISSTINFPPSTITPKLSSRFLKKLATKQQQKDWMHQTYSEMIQDVHYVTSHYYEIKDDGSSSLLLSAAAAPSNQKSSASEEESDNNNIKTQSIIAIVEKQRITKDSSSPCCVRDNNLNSSNKVISTLSIKNVPTAAAAASLHRKDDGAKKEQSSDIEEDNGFSDSDSESNLCNTYTTSSTDCNRRNNIFKFYLEQQHLERPMDEDDNDAITATPQNQNHAVKNLSNLTLPSLLIKNNLMDHQQTSQQPEYNTRNVKKGNKKVKFFKSILQKMRNTAEKPFWAIDRHF